MREIFNKIFLWSKKNLANLLVGIILLIGIGLRLSLYGDMRESIATNDSSSYYMQANIPILSWEAFTARRLPSYPAFFNIFEPASGFKEPLSTSYPAAPGVGTRHKALDETYTNVVFSQAWISIISWSLFLVLLCRRLKTKILRPIATAVIVLFAFTPSLAEWDSILMTESLSFSLFALLTILTLELFIRVSEEKEKPGLITKITFVIWGLILPAWAFTRDSNANTLIILVVFFVFFLIFPIIRKQIPFYWVLGLAIWTAFLAYWYSTTTFAANRWVWGWFDIYNHWISGFPARLKFFTDHGMPRPWTEEWVKESGSKTYILFLINHPGFMVTELVGRLSDAFSENLQPFFYTYPTLIRQMVLAVGDIFHPLSSVAFIFPLFNGILIIITAIRNSFTENKSWFWFTLWIISMIYGLFMASFFGDSGGLIRHTLGAVVFMRLMVWLFPIILAEIISTKSVKNNTPGE
jgi:hypothetical protein